MLRPSPRTFRRPPWSQAASGPLYGLVYRRRGLAEAELQWRALWPLLARLGLARDARILDVGCGTGRHLAACGASGASPIGLDRSGAALARARRRVAAPLVRGAAGRLPFASERFDLVLSMFSAFGHDGRRAARAELVEFARVLRPGGLALLDLPEASRVRRGLRPATRSGVGGLVLDERRRLGPGGRSVHKRVELRRGRFRVARWFEHLPLLESDELRTWLVAAGLEPLRSGPGSDLAGFGPDRLLAIARRPAPAGGEAGNAHRSRVD